MLFRFSRITCAAFTALGAVMLPGAAAAQDVQQNAVLVSATRTALQDTEAPYASEVHTRADIERSTAHTVFDYLAQHSSVQVIPSYGNRNAPNITMRGFGEDGHQNVVITINGRRLNNIDNVPQLIGALSLSDIDRIEITKGSGAVLFGDGATAGTIQIYTKVRDRAELDLYSGNHGQRGAIASVGLVKDSFDLSATAEHSRSAGQSAPDRSGHRDAGETNTWRVASTIRPITGLRVEVEAGASDIDSRFPGALTPAQFHANPAQNNGSVYPQQQFNARHWSVGVEYALASDWTLTARHNHTNQDSLYPASGFASDYRTLASELALQYRRNAWLLNAGWQGAGGERSSGTNLTRKASDAVFVHAQHMWEQLTVSGGVRQERVRYRYADSATQLQQDRSLTSWELGVNQRLSPQWTVFANYSDAFVSPDIDRFFETDWLTGSTRFNGFIAPAKSRSLTLGANHVTPRNRLKAAVFMAKLHDEIYLEPISYANTNIDASHKYGIELQDQWQLSPRHQLSANYTWTRAEIDREVQGSNNYSGRQIPGVPTHSLTLGWNLRVGDQGNLFASHTWRSSTWAFGNFSNHPALRQAAYQSTDIAYRHQLQRHVQLYAGVSNLLDHANSVAVNAKLYPNNFERTWKLGARISY